MTKDSYFISFFDEFRLNIYEFRPERKDVIEKCYCAFVMNQTFYEREEKRMKKEKRLKKIIEKIAVRAAKEDANTACPLFTYQPVQPSLVKKLRKF